MSVEGSAVPGTGEESDVSKEAGGKRFVSERRSVGSVLKGFAPYALVATLSVALALIALRFWNAQFGIPLVYGGDALAHGMHFEQLDGNAWYVTEPRLGAPFDQHFQDWPLPDFMHLVLAKFFTIFTSNFAVVMNLTFLAGFPLVAMSALWVMRQFKVSTVMAVVMATLYSLIPYHFARSEDHLFLGLYYAVPFGIWLAARVAQGERLFTGRNWQTVRSVALCALISWTGVYYAAFTLILVLAGAVFRQITRWKKTSMLEGAAVAVLILGFVVVATAPALMYHAEHGENSLATQRQVQEADVYGLKIAQMLMPVQGHSINALSDFQYNYYLDFPLASEGGNAALGAVGSVGLLYMLGLLLFTTARRKLPDSLSMDGLFASFSGLLIVIATIGGISTFISLLLTSQIRSWNRVSIFIGFMALTVVGLLLDRLASKLRTKRIPSKRAPVAIATLVLLFGINDQALADWEPPYDQTSAVFLSDQKFFRQVEASMPADSQIYQLPRMAFPESPNVQKLGAYEQLKPYLHTEHLEWSFGGIKGRLESEWQTRLASPQDTKRFVEQIIDAGFDGLYIDRDGFDDSGAEVENNLRRLVGSDGIANSFGNKVFYDLRGYASGLKTDDAERNDLLFRSYVQPTDQFHAVEYDENGSWWWARHADVSLQVDNTAKSTSAARVDFELSSGSDDNVRFDIVWPDGQRQEVNAGKSAVRVSRDIDLKPGTSLVKIDSNAKKIDAGTDKRDLYFRVYNIDVSPR